MAKRRKPIIAIDGPAGAGKSTIASLLAKQLGFIHLDTGAFYRAVAFTALRHEHRLDDGGGLATLARHTNIEVRGKQLYIDEVDRTRDIRKAEIGRAVPEVAQHPQVREAVNERIRSLCKNGGVVLDGRDIGTAVFPDAEVKVFLTASLEVRAERHHKDLETRVQQVDRAQVLEDLRKRDHQDETRAVAPLKCASDAHLLDTSELSIEQVLGHLTALVREGSPTSEFPLPRPRS